MAHTKAPVTSLKCKTFKLSMPLNKSEMYLHCVLGLLPNRIACASVVPGNKALLITFGNNRKYVLSLKAIEDFDERQIADVRTSADGAELIVIGESGHETTIPWDYILYRCEPDYATAPFVSKARDVDPRLIGQRIRSLREERGMDIPTLAKRSGLARPNIYRLEAGLHRPQMETIAKTAKALGVAITDIVRTP